MAHLLTPTMGKVLAVARHARGSRKRFPAALDLFDRGTATFGAERSGILALKNFTPVHSLTTLRRDLDKLSLGSTIAEVFDLVIPENDLTAGKELFELLDLALNAINEATDLRAALRATAIACTRLGILGGYISESDTPPSTRSLAYALTAAEQFAHRRLLTKSTVRDLIARFSQRERGAPIS